MKTSCKQVVVLRTNASYSSLQEAIVLGQDAVRAPSSPGRFYCFTGSNLERGVRVLGTELRYLSSNGKVPDIPTHASVQTPHVCLAHSSTGSPTALFRDLAASHWQRAPGAGKNARAPCIPGRARGRGEGGVGNACATTGRCFPGRQGRALQRKGWGLAALLILTSLYRNPHAHVAARVPHRASR